MDTAICKITFHDGSWVKAELPTDYSQVQYAYDNFGMFASIEVLPPDDAAVVAHGVKSSVEICSGEYEIFFRTKGEAGQQVMKVRADDARDAEREFDKFIAAECIEHIDAIVPVAVA
jgi:hypothetical protein